MHGVASSIRLHIERKDPLDERDFSGQTALMIAARRNHLEACSLLLQAGANPDLQDKNGLTALHLAEQAGAADTCRMLAELERTLVQAVPESAVGQDSKDSPDCNRDFSSVAHSTPWVFAEEEVASAEWEPVTESEPPKDDEVLLSQTSQTQASISAHIPFDPMAIPWDEVSVYLPERLQSEALSGSLAEGLRVVILRCLREGSVPSVSLESLLEEEPATSENVRRLTSQVIEDLGAELDERFEFLGVFEDSRVAPPINATDIESSTLDEALQYLEGLLQPRNDPGRIFAKHAYDLQPLPHEEEVEVAKAMEQALECALDALSRWPEGLEALLRKCEEVTSGRLPLKRVQKNRNVDTDELHVPEPEAGEPLSPSHLWQIPAPVPGEDDDSDLEAPQAADELDEFARQEALLRHLTALPTGGAQSTTKVRAVLDEMRLSGTLLCSLDKGDKKQAEAREFTAHITRFLESRDLLVRSNLKLVVPLVKRYLGTGADFADLLQEGHIGLIRAVDKFDWRRGYKFSTMATWWIRQQISRAAPDHARLIRLPLHGVEKTWEMKRLIRQHHDEHGQSPPICWLADRLGLTELKAESYLRTMSEPLPLDVMESNPWLPEPDEADPLENAARKESVDRAEELLQHLGSKRGGKMAEKVLRMRYGIGIGEDLTLDEIGRRYSLTRERIRQIETKAIKLVRSHLRAATSSDEMVPDGSDFPLSASNMLAASRSDAGAHVTTNGPVPPTGSSPSPEPNRVDKTDRSTGNENRSTQSSNAFTERQLELLYAAKAIGIKVMTYLESGRYETLVMLAQRNSKQEKEIAAELLEAGFRFKPGHGYYV